MTDRALSLHERGLAQVGFGEPALTPRIIASLMMHNGGQVAAAFAGRSSAPSVGAGTPLRRSLLELPGYGLSALEGTG
jgi:hypothetical protein